MSSDPERPLIDAHPIGGFVRRVRRLADLSQRQLAERVQHSAATVGGLESGRRTPSLDLFVRILAVGGLRLVVVDAQNRWVAPLQTWPEVADLAGRRFPAHLDTIVDPQFGEWWADGFGLTRPPETFRRCRAVRDWERRQSRWEVRVAQLREVPAPRYPGAL